MRAPIAFWNHNALVDADTLLYWRCNDGALPLVNSGSGSAANIGNVGGSPNPTLNGSAVVFTGAQLLYSANSPYAGPTGATVTLNVWCKPTTFGANHVIACKAYRPYATGWTSPFLTWYFAEDAAAGGTWTAFITIAGTFHQINISAAPSKLTLNAWNMLTITLDHGVFTAWLNGVACPGAISGLPDAGLDYTSGGPYEIGGVSVSGTPGSYFIGQVAGVRADQVVRSSAYLLALYAAGPP